jgi:hypothetical protein
MKPFRSEYEGWMGNYGNTVDRWYHRAAVVMWPKERGFTIRAKSSPSWAVEQLSQLLKDRSVDQVRQRAQSLLPFWSGCAPREEGTAFFAKLLRVALPLDDPALATGLIALCDYVVGQLGSVLSMPPREPDDWSIAPPVTCDCALCTALAAFLRDPRRVEYCWPLAKERRRHVHQTIDRYALPVSLGTLRRGSPYTLVLKKLPALFEKDAALRKEQKAQLAWLVPRQREFAGSA